MLLPAANEAAYGAAVSRATRVPSTQNSTRRTPWSSLAVAVMPSVEVNVAPTLGATRATAGARLAECELPFPPGVEAGAPGRAIDVQLAVAGEASTLPAGSVARTSTVCPPSV